MPHSFHQGVVSVFRDDPALAFDLLRSVFDVDLPRLTEVHDRRGELDRLAPAAGDTGELRPDLVLSAKNATDDLRDGSAMIIAVQGQPNTIKQWRIWVYWALVAERFRLATAILMVPLSDETARWGRSLRRPQPGAHEGLRVLDRHNMPRITSLAEARRRASMAVLSALVHAVCCDLEVMRTGWTIALELEDDRRWRYASSILSTIPEHEQPSFLEMATMSQRYELTEIERNSGSFHKGKREGKLEGKLEGIAQARLEGLVELALTVLELRQLPLDPASEHKIRTCSDPALLERWVERAKRVSELSAVFE